MCMYGEGFARAYDALMQEDYSYARYADYLVQAFDMFGAPPNPQVVDLGCGTGSLCVELAKRGYDMTGIDNSPQMLAEASKKAEMLEPADILFLEQELDAIELHGAVGAFISTIDSVNYVTDKRRLRRLFKRAGKYLAPGGLFIFDVNTRYKLENVIGNETFFNISDDLCYFWESRHYKTSATSVFDLTFFMRESGGRWRRYDETHRQRAYEFSDFAAAAAGAGMCVSGVHSFLGFGKPRKDALKINYILKKK